MRPVSIEISAFGPYVATQRVDFTRFDGDALFLIRGNTGSGKTTILDAMCLAMYGKLPGARSRGVVQLDRDVAFNVRPAAADDALATKVVLVIDFGARRYRFTRIPSFRKGSGALVTHKATLEELIDGQWVALESRIDAVNQFAKEYIGLDVEQFAQLILLPQGEFSKFLQADFKTREDILTKLFPLRVFEEIQEWFKRQRQQSDEAIKAAEQGRADAWLELRTVAESDDDMPSGEPDADVREAVQGWVDALAAELDEAIETAARQETEAAAELQQLTTAIAQAEAANQGLLRYRTAVTAIEVADKSLASLERRVGDDSIARPYSHSLPGIIHGLQAEADGKQTLITHSTAVQRKQAEVDELKRVASSAAADREAKVAQVQTCEDALAASRAAFDQMDSVAVDAQQVDSHLDKLQQHRELLRDRDAAQTALTSATTALKAAGAARGKADKALAAEVLKINRGAAADLAELLEEGKPCLVCGSTEHPAKAKAPRSAGDQELYESLLEAAEQAHADEAEAHDDVTRHTATLQRIQVQVQKAKITETTSELAELLKSAQAAVKAAQDKIKQRESVRVAVSAAEEKLAQARVAAEASRATAETSATHADTAAGVLAEMAMQVPQDFDPVAARIEQEALRHRADTLGAVLTESQSAEQARAAAIAVRDEFQGDADKADVDLEPMRTAANTATARQKSAHSQVQRYRLIQQKVSESHVKFIDAAESARAAQVDGERWRDISTYIEGNAGRKIPLTRFYLAQRLAQVAAAASARLGKMSNGRYALVGDDSVRAKNGAQGGLALLVRDNENASIRGPETLSGGETFMASLSLALGLSDVVTAEAGGVRLDSLFIDEGFGSLDADTLEEVLDVLEGLREHNRLVGVVSHVDTLKERIPQQLLVEAGPTGSTIRHIVN